MRVWAGWAEGQRVGEGPGVDPAGSLWEGHMQGTLPGHKGECVCMDVCVCLVCVNTL